MSASVTIQTRWASNFILLFEMIKMAYLFIAVSEAQTALKVESI